MAVTPDELWLALSGRADEETRNRVLAAMNDGDPYVERILEMRRQQAICILRGDVLIPPSLDRELSKD